MQATAISFVNRSTVLRAHPNEVGEADWVAAIVVEKRAVRLLVNSGSVDSQSALPADSL